MKYLFGLVTSLFMPFVGMADGPVGGSVGIDNPLKDINSISDFVVVVLNNIVLPIGSVVVVLFIIYTGFLFVTARGNPEKIEAAKRTLLWVVIGAAILLGATVISGAIKGTLCEIAPQLPGCYEQSSNFVGPPRPPGS